MKKIFITLVFTLVSICSFAQFNMQRPIPNQMMFNRFDMTQYTIVDSLVLERIQTYVPDSMLLQHIQDRNSNMIKENQIIQLGTYDYLFELPTKENIVVRYNKDKTKAIITNSSIIQGIGLHVFEFNIQDNKRRQIFYYDDDNILCGLIYDKGYKVAKYFRYEKKDIGRRQFRRMRQSFRRNF